MDRGWLAASVVSIIAMGVVPWSGMAADSKANADKVAKEAREAIEATKEYTIQQKEAFQRKVQEELVAIHQQIVVLREKIAHLSESTRADLQKSLTELEKKKESAKERLEELKEVTDGKWRDVQERMNIAMNELKHSYHKLMSRMP
jgi:TolA-binding protein